MINWILRVPLIFGQNHVELVRSHTLLGERYKDGMFTHQHGNLGKQLGWMIVESSGSLVVCCSSAMFSSGFAVNRCKPEEETSWFTQSTTLYFLNQGSLIEQKELAFYWAHKWIGHVLESKVDIITPENLWIYIYSMLGELCQTTDCNHRKHLAYMMVVESCQNCNQNLCCSSEKSLSSRWVIHKVPGRYPQIPPKTWLWTFATSSHFAWLHPLLCHCCPPVFAQNFPEHMHRFLVTSPSLARQFQCSTGTKSQFSILSGGSELTLVYIVFIVDLP